MASYSINQVGIEHATELIAKRQYVLRSEWGDVQPRAAAENAYLERHGWEKYAQWFLGLTDGAGEQTKAGYAFVIGDFRRIHRSGIIACHYRAAEWRLRRSSWQPTNCCSGSTKPPPGSAPP